MNDDKIKPKQFRTIKASQLPRNRPKPNPLPSNVWDRIEFRLRWRRGF